MSEFGGEEFQSSDNNQPDVDPSVAPENLGMLDVQAGAVGNVAPEAVITEPISAEKQDNTPETQVLTPEQEKNVQIMEKLKSGYPDAFVEGTTDNGKKYMLIKRPESIIRLPYIVRENKSDSMQESGNIGYGLEPGSAMTIAISLEGITQIRGASQNASEIYTHDLSKFNLSPIFDSSRANLDFTQVKNQNDGSLGSISEALTRGYSDVNIPSLKKLLIAAEEQGKIDIEKEKEKQSQLTAQHILDQLL